MNSKVLIGVGFAISVVAICAWYLWSQREPAELTAGEHVPVEHRRELVESNRVALAPRPPGTSPPGQENRQTPPASTPVTQQEADVRLANPLMRAYAEMLADTTGGLQWVWRAAKLPRMDRPMQDWVMQEVTRIEGLTNKGAHLFLLAKKGDLDAARFIWNLLTDGLAGQELTAAEEQILFGLPSDLGQSARFHTEIVGWLEQGGHAGYWVQNRKWLSQDAVGADSALQFSRIRGLGASGRTEGMDALRRLRYSAEAARDAGILAKIADAAGGNAMVARYGDAWFAGEAFGRSTDGYIRMLIAW